MHAQLLKILLITGLLIVTHEVMAEPSRPTVIYGDDNRQDYYQVSDQQVLRTADSTVALIRAANLTQSGNVTNIATVPWGQSMGLCSTERYYSQESAAFCSGFLVAPSLVVTAGHCIADQAACLNTRMVFGFRLNQQNALPRSVPTDDVYSCLQIVRSVSVPTGEDFAVVKLDRPVAHFPPLAYRTSGKINAGEGLYVIGHPGGLPLKVAGGANVRTVQPQFLVANLDTYGGNSGSAVFNSVTGEVEGVLVRGENDFVMKNGCRISNVCPNDGCRGEDVTLFERVLPYIK